MPSNIYFELSSLRVQKCLVKPFSLADLKNSPLIITPPYYLGREYRCLQSLRDNLIDLNFQEQSFRRIKVRVTEFKESENIQNFLGDITAFENSSESSFSTLLWTASPRFFRFFNSIFPGFFSRCNFFLLPIFCFSLFWLKTYSSERKFCNFAVARI